MGKLGISLYPEKTTFSEDQHYLMAAKKHHFSRVFMNLLLFQKKEVAPIVRRMRETIAYANQLEFEVYVDINPYTLQALNISYDDLDYFAELGVAGIRLDMGFTGKEEAMMTKNPYGIKIEINMSNDDHYLARIFDYNPNRNHLVGCHNFFPQAYTGLSIPQFIDCSRRFIERGLNTAAFVTAPSGKIGPWSLHEGLCTVDCHRHLPLGVQVRHLKALQVTEDIIIGNAYASDAELQEMQHAFEEDQCTLTVIPQTGLTETEKKIVEAASHTYRGDRSEYMIRSSMPRFTYMKASVEANHSNQPIHKGDVLILNNQYGQYKAELQLALKSRPQDHRVNKVGRIKEEEQLLLDTLTPYTSFSLTTGYLFFCVQCLLHRYTTPTHYGSLQMRVFNIDDIYIN